MALFAGQTPEQIVASPPSAFQSLAIWSAMKDVSQRHINRRLVYLSASALLYETLPLSAASQLRHEFSLGVCLGRELLQVSDEKIQQDRPSRVKKGENWVSSAEVIKEISLLTWRDLNVLALLTEPIYQCVKNRDASSDIYRLFNADGDTPVKQNRAHWFRTLWNMPLEKLDSLYASKARIDEFSKNAIRLNELQVNIPFFQAIKEVTGIDYYQSGYLTGVYTADTLVSMLQAADLKDQEIFIGNKGHEIRMTVLPDGIRVSDVNFPQQYFLFSTWDQLKDQMRGMSTFGEVLDVYAISILSKEPREFQRPGEYYRELHNTLQQRPDQANRLINRAMMVGDEGLFRQLLSAYRGQSLEDFIKGVCPPDAQPMVNFQFSESDKFTVFLTACGRRDPIFVTMMLEKKLADVNETISRGITGLLVAVYWENIEVVRLLLAEPSLDINYVVPRDRAGDIAGKCALDLAIKSKNTAIIEALLQRPDLIADPDQLNAIIELAGVTHSPALAELTREKLKQCHGDTPEQKPLAPSLDLARTATPVRTFAQAHPQLAFTVFAKAMGSAFEDRNLTAFNELVSNPVNAPFLHQIFSRPEEASDSPFGGISFLDSPGNILSRIIEVEWLDPGFARQAFDMLKAHPRFADGINQYPSTYPEVGTVLQSALQKRSSFFREMLSVPGVDFNLQRPCNGKTIIHDLALEGRQEELTQVAELVQKGQILLDFDLKDDQGKSIETIVPKPISLPAEGAPLQHEVNVSAAP